MGIFKKNISKLIQTNPKLAAKLVEIKTNERFEVFVDPKDALNINILDHTHDAIFYDNNPLEAVTTQLDEFEKSYNRYPVLYIYGIANALFVKLLLQNKNHTKIIVIEPEIELLYVALNLMDFSSEIERYRLILLLSDDINFSTAVDIAGHRDIKVFAKTFHLEINIPYYSDHYSEQVMASSRDFIRAIEHVITGLGNDSMDALIGLEWHLANIEQMATTPTLVELIKKAKNTDVAIVISTGPSLAKQLPLLKEIATSATLISVDASLPILERHNIKPDIVTSIERVALTAEFYKKTSEEFKQGIICAMPTIAHPALIESVGSGTLQLSMRPFGYTRHSTLDDYGYLGIGMSAANMAYEIAFHSGFKTIILIGQDLAFSDSGISHSEGHVIGSTAQKDSDFYVRAYGGDGSVRTSVIWNMFRNFFERDIYDANQKGTTTIDATEGGAQIAGALEISFSEAIERYIDKNFIKKPIELEYPDSSTMQKNRATAIERIARMRDFAKRYQKQTAELFEKVATMSEHLESIKADKNLDKPDYDAIAALMGEIDELKAAFDTEEFTDIFIDATQALIVHHELEIARIQVRPIHSNDDKKLKMIDWIHMHKHWLFALAGIMEAELVAIERRGSQSQFVHSAKTSDDFTTITGQFYDYTREHSEFLLELIVDGEVVKTITHISSENSNKTGNFSLTIPAKYFNNGIYQISVREKTTGIIPMGLPLHGFMSADKYNEAKFLESLETANYEELKNMYKPNCVGFLATKENMEDEEFVEYINEIIKDFPEYDFKALYFDKNSIKEIKNKFQHSNLNLVEIKNIKDIFINLQVLLGNFSKNKVEISLAQVLILNSYNIACIPLNLHLNKSITIKQFSESIRNHYHNFFENIELFGYTKKDIEIYGKDLIKILTQNAIDRYNIKIEIDMQSSIRKLLFITLYIGFKNNDYFKNIINIDRLNTKLLHNKL